MSPSCCRGMRGPVSHLCAVLRSLRVSAVRMWGRNGRQFMILSVMATMLLLATIIAKMPRDGAGTVSFTEEQIQYLQQYAQNEDPQPPHHHQPQPQPAQAGPKERSEDLKQRVGETCKALNISLPLTAFMMAHMHFDDARKAIYCFVPKVACTSWKRVWMKMTGVVPPDKDLATIDRYSVHTRLPLLAGNKDKAEKLRTYKKFLFVRHPFDRALSAYKDKLEHEDKASAYDFHKEIGRRIEKKYRGSAITDGHHVTFPDFIRFISEPGFGTFEQRNEHWLSMHEICNPCAVQYDFIGKYETLKEDADYVLGWLGAKDIIGPFPSSDRPFHARRYDPKYFNQLGHKEKLAFFSKYLADFLAFGYDFL